MTTRVRLLETVVEIRAEEDEAARLLDLLWKEMAAGDSTAPARVYEVARDVEGGWRATSDEGIEAIHETLWGLTDALRYRMLELCEERLQGFVTLHAAAVAHGDELVLLAGESGAGKTTLTLALLDAGWTYLSDDLAPVSRDTALVHPFPKPLGVKDAATFESVRDAYPDPAGAPGGSFLVPPSRWKVATEPLRARALLFPRYDAGASLDVEELTAGKGAALASAYLRRLDPPAIALLNRVCTGAECARLTYSSTADAFAAIEDLLNRRE